MSIVRCEDCEKVIDLDFIDQCIEGRFLCLACQDNYEEDGSRIKKIEVVHQKDKGYYVVEVDGEIWTDNLGENMRFIYLEDAEDFAEELEENLKEE